jgi:hypothetical protein
MVLGDVSCTKQLRRLQGRTKANIALNTHYSSHHKHANEITMVVCDADTSAFNFPSPHHLHNGHPLALTSPPHLHLALMPFSFYAGG